MFNLNKYLIILFFVLLLVGMVSGATKREVYDYQGSGLRFKVNYSRLEAINITATEFFGDLNASYVQNPPWIPLTEEPNLNVNSSIWWASVSNWVNNWFIKVGNNLDFNETKLNNTIIAIDTATNASMKIYVDSQDIIFNDSMTTYVDEQDIIFNDSMKVYVDSQDTLFNDSMQIYVDAQDVIYNESMKLYSDTTKVNITGDTMTGNLIVNAIVTANKFFGRYDWLVGPTPSSIYLSFNDTQLDFSETNLNATIAAKIAETMATYLPTSFSIVVGTNDNGGELVNISTIDETYLEVGEQTGTPGFDIRINFTEVVEFSLIETYELYTGGVVHEVDIDIQRCSNDAWDTLDLFNTQTEFTLKTHIALDAIYNCGGTVRTRFYHTTAGNPSHFFQLDSIQLIFTSGSVGSGIGGSGTASFIPHFVDSTSLGDSIMFQDDSLSTIFVNGNFSVTGNVSAFNFFQDGNLVVDVSTADYVTLTDDSMADSLHRHSELSASDGIPDRALVVDTLGNVGIGTSTFTEFEFFNVKKDIVTFWSANFINDIGSININLNTPSDDEDKVINWKNGTTLRWTMGMENPSEVKGDFIFAQTANPTTPVLLLQDGTGKIGINTNNPYSIFNIKDNNPVLTIESSDGSILENDVVGKIAFRTNDFSTAGVGEFASMRVVSPVNWDTIVTNNGELDIAFFTTNTVSSVQDYSERMRITHDGNVGIGTDSPSVKLDIKGIFNDENGGLGIGENAEIKLYARNSATLSIMIGASDVFRIDSQGMEGAAVNAGAIFNEASTSTNPTLLPSKNDKDTGIGHADVDQLSLIAGGVEGVRIIEDAGVVKVGIGTDSPDTKLDVTTAGPNGIVLNQDTVTSTASARLFFKDDSGANSIYRNNGKLEFRTGATVGSASGTAKVFLDDDGNVGIGTATPLAILNLEGSNGLPDAASHVNTAANSMAIFGRTGSTTDMLFGIESFDLGWIQMQSATNVEYDLALNPVGGNVGIGTSSPDNPLDVKAPFDADYVQKWYSNTGNVGAFLYVDGVTGAGNEGSFFGLVDASATASSYSIMLDSRQGANSYFNVNGGNVGIGTASPDTKLDIVTDGADLELRMEEDAGTHDVRTHYRRGSVDWYTGLIGGNDFKIVYSLGEGNELTPFTILENGDVGIGTTSPQRNLHIFDSASPFILMTNADTGSTNTDGLLVGVETTEGAVLWNYEDNYMRFGTNNTERIRISSGGNVGIGTTSPDAKLEIVGDHVAGKGLLMLNSNSGNISAQTFYVNDVYKGAIFGGTDDTFNIGTPAGSSAKFNLYTESTNAITIDSSQNVGIGTASPQRKLHISSSDNELLRVESTDRFAVIELKDNSVSWSIVADGDSGGFLKFSDDLAGGGDTILTLDSGNNRVGIGTVSPLGKLQIGNANSGTGEPTYHGDLIIQGQPSSSNAIGGIEFKNSASDSGYGWKMTAVNAATDPFIISRRANSPTWVDYFTILGFGSGAGNVGIGVTDPDQALEVNGDVHIQGLEGAYSNGEAYVCVYNNGTIFAKDSACA